jgi:hypothetical protein
MLYRPRTTSFHHIVIDSAIIFGTGRLPAVNCPKNLLFIHEGVGNILRFIKQYSLTL